MSIKLGKRLQAGSLIVLFATAAVCGFWLQHQRARSETFQVRHDPAGAIGPQK